MVLQSLKTRLKDRFNVSVAEILPNDKWQIANIAVVNAGEDKRIINSTLSSIINFVEGFNRAQVINYEMEII